MSDSNKANELRKAGKYEEAIKIYNQLWESNEDKFIAAGLIHCYRKQKKFDKALEFINKTKDRFCDFNWYKNEYSWTIISGQLNKLAEAPTTEEVVEIATKILSIDPDPMAYNKAIFKVAKVAKLNQDWEILNNWLERINPENLKRTEEGKDWSESEIWHYYKAIFLLNTGQFEQAISFINQVKDRFKTKAKFFDRLVAKAFQGKNDLEGSEEMYAKLTKNGKGEWWMLHEYAKIMMELGKNDDAIKLMYRAGIAAGKLKNKVSLIHDIANILVIENKLKEALYHFVLTRNIREEEGWSISPELITNIEKLSSIHSDIEIPRESKKLFNYCKKIWTESLGVKDHTYKKNKRKNLKGKVNLSNSDRPFCFIQTKGRDSYFCSKSDLPEGTVHNQLVTFDLKPSFDKKKNRETFKAYNVRIL